MTQCESLTDEQIVFECDLGRCREIQDKVFNFALQRETESYKLVAKP